MDRSFDATGFIESNLLTPGAREILAKNTGMKGLEADVKKLFQMMETMMEENRSERARLKEATDLKFKTLQMAHEHYVNYSAMHGCGLRGWPNLA
ncbi:hypothetical protein PIB30_027598 [Stylosanthes scabra]|uniref:Uncharacterized protein n=1 Tax=Stylosanthes scabra TaxID=79078 RepID=A0ABU6X8A2_9FABA|nr:hypothetical protein [Stylosanthes scabra]